MKYAPAADTLSLFLHLYSTRCRVRISCCLTSLVLCPSHDTHTNTSSWSCCSSSKTVQINLWLATSRKLVTSGQCRCDCRCIVHPYNKSGAEKHLCLHSSELYSIRHPCSVIPPPHLRSPTSLFMHYFFPLVFRGYFLLSSLTSVCPFSVLPSLKHLPLISRRHSKPSHSLLFTSIYIVYFLPMAFCCLSVFNGPDYMPCSACG